MLSDEVTNTIIISVTALATAAIGAPAGIKTIKARKARRAAEVDDEEQEAVERYSADPGQFVKDVLRSNAQLTERVEAAEAKADRIERAFEAFKQEDRKFRTALARWVGQIMNAWGVEPEMPYPEGDDAMTLADVIPSALEATQPRRPPRHV
ncbi:hypothetical protein HUN59_05100 [Curtobacterium sp. Csp2]|uniref:hypothetical protein n=1 Tax=Curtobacterium sp. Csp2 TaxID=2495430 RepID=UPI00158079ED|nr:hypothetical protein [Curtobacterium sp. Csp2]QKS15674.1 hypothetical protein HUN59_05100 [Curtobacterium sp. Csp2]